MTYIGLARGTGVSTDLTTNLLKAWKHKQKRVYMSLLFLKLPSGRKMKIKRYDHSRNYVSTMAQMIKKCTMHDIAEISIANWME